jgi:hypothetical protein
MMMSVESLVENRRTISGALKIRLIDDVTGLHRSKHATQEKKGNWDAGPCFAKDSPYKHVEDVAANLAAMTEFHERFGRRGEICRKPRPNGFGLFRATALTSESPAKKWAT